MTVDCIFIYRRFLRLYWLINHRSCGSCPRSWWMISTRWPLSCCGPLMWKLFTGWTNSTSLALLNSSGGSLSETSPHKWVHSLSLTGCFICQFNWASSDSFFHHNRFPSQYAEDSEFTRPAVPYSCGPNHDRCGVGTKRSPRSYCWYI